MVNKFVSDFSLTNNGLRDWLYQRISAVIIAIYLVILLGFFILHPYVDYLTFRQFFYAEWMVILSFVFLLNLLIHAWIGIWTVLTDYIKLRSLRIMLEISIIFLLLIYFFWGALILGRG